MPMSAYTDDELDKMSTAELISALYEAQEFLSDVEERIDNERLNNYDN